MKYLSVFIYLLSLSNISTALEHKIVKGTYIVKFEQAIKDLDENIEIISKQRNIYLFKNNKFDHLKYDHVLWSQPLKEVVGNPMESADPRFNEQIHHQIIKSEQAWQISTGSENIVVAVTDNGFQLDHDDMQGSWWSNEDEIAGNNIDDDKNGFVDDINGWNFDADNNDVTPGEQNSHGTHVAGIIAAQAHNGIGVAGVAPKVKVMPLKFYGENRWSSLTVFNTYKYAIENGAKIISTSYNIDGFVDDKLYLEALEMAHQNDVLVFNSAGNDRRKDPPRKVFENLVLVCSTQSNPKRSSRIDQLSKFSNYGEGIDLCAPGDPILSTVNGRYLNESRYGSLEGTSMATPVAASIAALIWSQNPTWTKDQVLAKLLKSCDDVSAQNSRYSSQMGAGRVNALKAIQ